MGIVFKHIIKNVFGKFKRTLLVIICITICSLVAMFTFDFVDTVQNLLEAYSASYFGNADLYTLSANEDLSFLDSPGFPEYEVFYLNGDLDSLYTRIDGEYAIVQDNTVRIKAGDIDGAAALGILNRRLELNEDQVAVSETLANKFGFSVGDVIYFHNSDKELVEYEVAYVEDFSRGFLSGNTVFMTLQGFYRIHGENINNSLCFIDILDDSERAEAKAFIDDNYPENNIGYIFENEEEEEQMMQLRLTFVVLFAICLLMVVFVVVSVSDRIVVERMSVVGTLRSLGLNMRTTTCILLAESGCYGLIGGLLGVLIYIAIRPFIINALIVLDDAGAGALNMGEVSLFTVALVIFGAIMLEFMCSVKETAKAVKTSVRDIIFSNKDTEYVINSKLSVTGAVLLGIGIIILVVPVSSIIKVVAALLFEVGFALLIPVILKCAAKCLARLSSNKPGFALALAESSSKKSTVGTAVLIGTVAALCMVFVSIGLSLNSYLNTNYSFTSDIEIYPSAERYMYSYIETLPEVTGVDFVQYNEMSVSINGVKKYSPRVYCEPESDDGWLGYNPFEVDVTNLADDEMVLSAACARRIGVSDGDVVEVVFNYNQLLSQTYMMRIIVDTSADPTYRACVNRNVYSRIADDSIRIIHVNSTDPDKTKADIFKYSGSTIDQEYSKTLAELLADQAKSRLLVMVFLFGIIGLGVAVTFIGATGNLLLGFESRKREFAVLLSTSMTRLQLNKMLIEESLIASGVVLISALPAGLLMVLALRPFWLELELGSALGVYPLESVGILVLLWIVFGLTSLTPIRALRKMKLADQLKYE